MAKKERYVEYADVHCYVRDRATKEIIDKGQVRYNVTAMKQFVTKAVVGIVVTGALLGIGGTAISAKVDEYKAEQAYVQQVEYDERKEEARDTEATYSFDYHVGYGQTLSGIVYSFQDDPNIAQPLIQSIANANDLSHPSLLQANSTIKLHGVPESALMDPELVQHFGYTVNYDYLAPEIEINDRLDWAEKYLNNVSLDTEAMQVAHSFISKELVDLQEKYQMANSMIGEDKEEAMEIVRQDARDLCSTIETHLWVYVDGKDETVGVYFGKFKAPRAYQVSDTLDLTVDEGRTLG